MASTRAWIGRVAITDDERHAELHGRPVIDEPRSEQFREPVIDDCERRCEAAVEGGVSGVRGGDCVRAAGQAGAKCERGDAGV